MLAATMFENSLLNSNESERCLKSMIMTDNPCQTFDSDLYGRTKLITRKGFSIHYDNARHYTSGRLG